jgi:hypothetical protein
MIANIAERAKDNHKPIVGKFTTENGKTGSAAAFFNRNLEK